MLAVLDYPESEAHPAFNVLLRVNFKSGLAQESFGVKFIGSEGIMTADFTGVRIDKTPQPDQFDYTIRSFSDETQKKLTAEWDAKHISADSRISDSSGRYLDTSANEPQLEHHKNFYRSIREGQPLIEDPTFGLRAAAPALLTNESLFQRKIMSWDPQAMTLAKV
jgi:hypothetical protein